MKKWKTTLHLNYDNGTMKSRKININSGIFQGDSLDRSNKHRSHTSQILQLSYKKLDSWRYQELRQKKEKALTKERSQM